MAKKDTKAVPAVLKNAWEFVCGFVLQTIGLVSRVLIRVLGGKKALEKADAEAEKVAEQMSKRVQNEKFAKQVDRDVKDFVKDLKREGRGGKYAEIKSASFYTVDVGSDTIKFGLDLTHYGNYRLADGEKVEVDDGDLRTDTVYFDEQMNVVKINDEKKAVEQRGSNLLYSLPVVAGRKKKETQSDNKENKNEGSQDINEPPRPPVPGDNDAPEETQEEAPYPSFEPDALIDIDESEDPHIALHEKEDLIRRAAMAAKEKKRPEWQSGLNDNEVRTIFSLLPELDNNGGNGINLENFKAIKYSDTFEKDIAKIAENFKTRHPDAFKENTWTDAFTIAVIDKEGLNCKVYQGFAAKETIKIETVSAEITGSGIDKETIEASRTSAIYDVKYITDKKNKKDTLYIKEADSQARKDYPSQQANVAASIFSNAFVQEEKCLDVAKNPYAFKEIYKNISEKSKANEYPAFILGNTSYYELNGCVVAEDIREPNIRTEIQISSNNEERIVEAMSLAYFRDMYKDNDEAERSYCLGKKQYVYAKQKADGKVFENVFETSKIGDAEILKTHNKDFSPFEKLYEKRKRHSENYDTVKEGYISSDTIKKVSSVIEKDDGSCAFWVSGYLITKSFDKDNCPVVNVFKANGSCISQKCDGRASATDALMRCIKDIGISVVPVSDKFLTKNDLSWVH